MGGYSIDGPAEVRVTAEPFWIALRGRPQGGRGDLSRAETVSTSGFPASPIAPSCSAPRSGRSTIPCRSAPLRASEPRASVSMAANFSPAPASTVDQLMQAGRTFWSPVLQKTTPLEPSRWAAWLPHPRRRARHDERRAGQLRHAGVFRCRQGILPGPFALRPPAPRTCAHPTSAPRRSTSRAAATRRASAST